MVTGLIPSVKGPEVKVWNRREIQAVVDAAHELNTPVVGHCRNSISTRESAEAGMDLIYHSSYMDDEALKAVVEHGSTLCPTFTLLGNLVEYGEKVGTAPELLDVFKAELDVTGVKVDKAHRAGVRVITGSETGFAITPCGEWHARELAMLVQYAGFSPPEASTAATSPRGRGPPPPRAASGTPGSWPCWCSTPASRRWRPSPRPPRRRPGPCGWRA